MDWRDSSPRLRTKRGEGGATLIEILVACVLVGSAAIVLVMGVGTLFASAIQTRESTTSSVIARDYAEALDLAVAQASSTPGTVPMPPRPDWCHASYSVAFTPPAGYSVSVAYGACPVYNATTPQFQTVAITVTSPKGYIDLLRTVVRQS